MQAVQDFAGSLFLSELVQMCGKMMLSSVTSTTTCNWYRGGGGEGGWGGGVGGAVGKRELVNG